MTYHIKRKDDYYMEYAELLSKTSEYKKCPDFENQDVG